MKLVLDTNAYSAFARNDAHAVDAVQRGGEIEVPLIVLGELRAGFQAGTLSQQNEAQLQRFLNQPRVHILSLDEQTTFHYARLSTQLRRQGTPLPQNDLWIAALVVQHDCILLTYDKHFDRLPQIPRWGG
jgi:predicted nucleic acid-binding protein